MHTRWTRRAVLISSFALAGCAIGERNGDNDGTGSPTTMPTEQSDAANSEWLLASACADAGQLADALQVPPDARGWTATGKELHQAHLTRLLNRNPFQTGGETFESAHPTQTPAPTPAGNSRTWDDVLNQVTALRSTTLEANRQRALQHAGTDQPLALLYASLAASCVGPVTGPAPVRSSGEPLAFSPTTRDTVAPIVLTHVWALIYAFEVGIGRLDSKDQTRAAGRARLNVIKQLRDDLLTWPELAKPPKQLPDYDLGGPVDTPDQVRAVWGRRELSLLDAWGRLMAASSGDEAKQALAIMLGQAQAVQDWGTGLPYWPGWV